MSDVLYMETIVVIWKTFFATWIQIPKESSPICSFIRPCGHWLASSYYLMSFYSAPDTGLGTRNMVVKLENPGFAFESLYNEERVT